MFILIGGITVLSHIYNLNNIKSKTVGDGQHGTARFLSKAEKMKVYQTVEYTPKEWRETQGQPKLPQGVIVGCSEIAGRQYAMVATDDVHTMMIGAAGCGKTAYWLYPNLEYACASGMSFLTTDTKGDLYRNYGNIAKQYYGYDISIIDLRNPTKSDGNNLLHLVNKYMDLYKANPDNLSYKAKAEKYAKIIGKTIIFSEGDSASYGQNAFFYDAAEGLLTSTILLIAEFAEPKERHIVSVFKLIQDLLVPDKNGGKGKNQFHKIMELLPEEHKTRWFAGAALNTSEQAMQSVMSTAMSRLNSFLDSELEQILCFDTAIDAEKFCSQKCAIFIVLPEENPATYFMVSLLLQQFYREILMVADEQGGALKNRVMFYMDEFGTLPAISSAEMMYSASRSRKLSLVSIIQSFQQLEKNYGKEGAAIIQDNCQITIAGGFAPTSETAEIISKSLGSRTVMSGSVSRSKNDPSQSLQMIERPLMTADELKSMKKGNFIVMKTGTHPFISKLKLFFDWGITFDTGEYKVADKGARPVKYTSRNKIEKEILNKYPKNEICEQNETFNESEIKHRNKPNKVKPLRVIRDSNSKEEYQKELKMLEDNKKLNAPIIPISN
jgi:type IV secretion system protein VirD4